MVENEFFEVDDESGFQKILFQPDNKINSKTNINLTIVTSSINTLVWLTAIVGLNADFKSRDKETT